MASANVGPETVPASVRTLDDLLNRRIAAASTPCEVDRWLHAKVTIKRRLAAAPPDCLEREARSAIDAVARNQRWAVNAERAS